jgi:hypothetical protein
MLVVAAAAVHGGDGDGDDVENSLITLNVFLILLHVNVLFFDKFCELPEHWQTFFNYCLVAVLVCLDLIKKF